MKRLAQWFPAWYIQISLLALSLMVVIGLYYFLGAGGIRSSGVKVSFNRDKDQGQLYKVNARVALLVQPDGYVNVVKYKRTPLPLILCGCYEPAGTIRNDAEYDTELLKLDAKQISQRFPQLWTLKESCMVMAMAFYLLMIILLIIAPVVSFFHRRKLRAG